MLGVDNDRVLVSDDGGALHVVRYENFKPMSDPNAPCASIVAPSQDVVIDLSGEKIDDLSLHRFLPDLARETTNLQLWMNELTCAGVVDLMREVPARCRHLTTIWLGNNAIGDVGARAVAVSFGVLPNLHSIFLDDNNITCAGARSIASHMPDANRLKRLGLHTNRLFSIFILSIVIMRPRCLFHCTHTRINDPKATQTTCHTNTSYMALPPFPISIVTILRFFAARSTPVASVPTCTTSSSSQSPARYSRWTATRSTRPSLS